MAKKGYWLVTVDVSDEERYKDYVAAGAVAYAKFGGKFVVRGGQCDAVEGSWNPRNVVVEFSSYQTALDCYNSPEYAIARAIRQEVAQSRFLIVEGFDG